MSGAEKAVKDLEQLAAADPEALIDSIEELLPFGTSQEAGVTTGVSAGLVTGVTGLADPVLSKGNGSLTQGAGYKPAVKCGAELLYCLGGCCTQAVPLPIWLRPSIACSPLVAHKQCLFPFCLPFVYSQASNFPLLVALQQARKSFDAAQSFALLQRSPVNKGF